MRITKQTPGSTYRLNTAQRSPLQANAMHQAAHLAPRRMFSGEIPEPPRVTDTRIQDTRGRIAMNIVKAIFKPHTLLYDAASRDPNVRGLGLAAWMATVGSVMLHQVLPIGLGTRLFEFFTQNGLLMIAGGYALTLGVPLLAAMFMPKPRIPDMSGATHVFDLNAPRELGPTAQVQEIESGIPHSFAFWRAKKDPGLMGVLVTGPLLLAYTMTIFNLWPFLAEGGIVNWIPQTLHHLLHNNLIPHSIEQAAVSIARAGVMLYPVGLMLAFSLIPPLLRGIVAPRPLGRSFPTLFSDVYHLAQRNRAAAAVATLAWLGLTVDMIAGLSPFGEWIANRPLGLGGGLAFLVASAGLPLLLSFRRRTEEAPLTPYGTVFKLASERPIIGSALLYLWGWIALSPVLHGSGFGMSLLNLMRFPTPGTHVTTAMYTVILFAGIPLLRALFRNSLLVRNFLFVRSPRHTLTPKRGPSLWDIAAAAGNIHGNKALVAAGAGLSLTVMRFADVGSPFFRSIWNVFKNDPTNLADSALILFASLCVFMIAGWSARNRNTFKPDGKTHYFRDASAGDAEHGERSPWRAS